MKFNMLGDANHAGPVRLSDVYSSAVGSAKDGVAASQRALYDAYNSLNSSISNLNSKIEPVNIANNVIPNTSYVHSQHLGVNNSRKIGKLIVVSVTNFQFGISTPANTKIYTIPTSQQYTKGFIHNANFSEIVAFHTSGDSLISESVGKVSVDYNLHFVYVCW